MPCTSGVDHSRTNWPKWDWWILDENPFSDLPATAKPRDCKALRESAARGERAVSGSVVPTGFEPGDVTTIQSQDLRQTPNQRAAECAAVGDDFPPLDPELAQVIEAWHTLPPAIREAILAMLRAAE